MLETWFLLRLYVQRNRNPLMYIDKQMSKNTEKKINSRKLMSISFTTFQSQEQNTPCSWFCKDNRWSGKAFSTSNAISKSDSSTRTRFRLQWFERPLNQCWSLLSHCLGVLGPSFMQSWWKKVFIMRHYIEKCLQSRDIFNNDEYSLNFYQYILVKMHKESERVY